MYLIKQTVFLLILVTTMSHTVKISTEILKYLVMKSIEVDLMHDYWTSYNKKSQSSPFGEKLFF